MNINKGNINNLKKDLIQKNLICKMKDIMIIKMIKIIKRIFLIIMIIRNIIIIILQMRKVIIIMILIMKVIMKYLIQIEQIIMDL